MSPQIHLASRSPRRPELLRQMNLRFEGLPVEVSERRTPGQSPAEYARAVSLAKAQAAVGLPLHETCELLQRFGVEVFSTNPEFRVPSPVL